MVRYRGVEVHGVAAVGNARVEKEEVAET